MSENGSTTPKSLSDFCLHLGNELRRGDHFIFISGDGGSGRTFVCEHVVNSLDGERHTVFIPCQADLTLQKLRELFLQQLLPGHKWDLNLNLADLLTQTGVFPDEPVLVVADDIDSVVSAFFTELLTVYEQYSGKGMFSFMVTAKPLWVEGRLRELRRTKAQLTVREVPPLEMEEALALVKHVFASHNLGELYTALQGKLPSRLMQCSGNIGRVIKYAERLMEDPKEIDNDSAASQDGFAPPEERRKRGGSAALFITIVCVIIVLACLAPLFMGTDIFSKLFGSSPKTDPDVQDELVVERTALPTTPAEQRAQNAAQGSQEQNTASGNGTEGGIAADGPRGSAEEAADDDGALLEDLDEEGLEADTPDSDSTNSVTLRGDTLNEIEKKGAEPGNHSDLPRRGGVDGSVAPAQDGGDDLDEQGLLNDPELTDESEEDSGEAVALQREDNVLRQAELESEQRLEEQRLKQEQERLAKAEAAAREAKEREEQALKAAAAAIEQAATAAASSAAATPAAPAAAPAAAPSQTAAVSAGDLKELNAKEGRHFTLQVIAGRDRAGVDAAVPAIASLNGGNYWIYQTERNGRPWYVLITGDYENAAAAARDAQKLPANLRAGGPFAKAFSRVKQEMQLVAGQQ